LIGWLPSLKILPKPALIRTVQRSSLSGWHVEDVGDVVVRTSDGRCGSGAA
jgi:hypothetical protein